MSGFSKENQALVNADVVLIERAAADGFNSPAAYASSGLSITTINRLLDAARAEGAHTWRKAFDALWWREVGDPLFAKITQGPHD